MRLFGSASVGLLLGALALPGSASAADIPLGAPATSAQVVNSREWTLTLGGYAMATPEFYGSDDYEFGFRPIFSISRADRLSRFTSFYDNASIALWDTGVFEAGITGKLNWKRDSSDNSALYGLNDVDYAVEVGGYAQFYPVDWLRVRGELRYGFGGFEGFVADIAADAIYRSDLWGGMTFSAGPRITFAGDGFVDAYYGITSTEAASMDNVNNYPVYDPSGGVYSVGLGGQIFKDFGNGFRGSVFGEWRYLTGDAADSPIVVQNGDRNQFQTGVSLSYTFFLGFE